MSLSHLGNSSSTSLGRTTTRSGRWLDVAATGPEPTTSTSSPVQREAADLLEAASRMHDSHDPQALLRVIGLEALALIAADEVAILSEERSELTCLLRLDGSGDELPPLNAAALRQSLSESVDRGAGQSRDPRDRPSHLSNDDRSSEPSEWASLMRVSLDSRRSGRSTQLLWYATTPNAFATLHDLAALFAGHASLALSHITERHTLARAIESRSLTGQATGILMHRYRLTAEQAFEVLKRYSQNRNVKLRHVAQVVNDTGELPT